MAIEGITDVMDEDDWSGGGQATFPHWFEGSEYMHRVACAIAKYGPIARTTLAQLLGLSQGALSRITSDLIYAGVIEELPGDAVARGPLPQGFTPKESSGRRGRPQTALALRANARTFVGIKAHGTSAIAAAVNAHGEVVSGRHEMAFPDRSPEQVTSVLAALVRECEADIAGRTGDTPLPAPTAVGIAIGGHVADDDRTVLRDRARHAMHVLRPLEPVGERRLPAAGPAVLIHDIRDSLDRHDSSLLHPPPRRSVDDDRTPHHAVTPRAATPSGYPSTSIPRIHNSLVFSFQRREARLRLE